MTIEETLKTFDPELREAIEDCSTNTFNGMIVMGKPTLEALCVLAYNTGQRDYAKELFNLKK